MFQAVQLRNNDLIIITRNNDPDKYGYSGWGIRFNASSQFSLPIVKWSKNVVIFCCGKYPPYGLDNITIKVGAKYFINITK